MKLYDRLLKIEQVCARGEKVFSGFFFLVLILAGFIQDVPLCVPLNGGMGGRADSDLFGMVRFRRRQRRHNGKKAYHHLGAGGYVP